MSARIAIVHDGTGGIMELPAGDSLVDNAARRRAELYSIQQREALALSLQVRARERVPAPSLNRSSGQR